MTRMKKRKFRSVFFNHRYSRLIKILAALTLTSFGLIILRWRVLVSVSVAFNSTVLINVLKTDLVANRTDNTTLKATAVPPHCHWIGPALPNVSQTARGIPFILHQIYSTEVVPEQYAKLIRGCRAQNPHFLHFLWTDSDAEAFVNNFYPRMKSLFSQYKVGVEKSDFFRILLLFHFGGVYIDMDVECVRPLHPALDHFNSSCILDRERELQTRLRWNRDSSAMNSAMMARPGHPFFKFLLAKLPGSLYQKNVMWRTGPFFLDDRLKEYRRLGLTGDSAVTVAPASAFSPKLDRGLFKLFKTRCRSYTRFLRVDAIRRRGCEEWRRLSAKANQDSKKEAILIHRFLHLAYKYHRKDIKLRTSLCSTVPRLTRYRSKG